MKLRMLVAIASLAFAGFTVPASAEEGDITVTVPFEFVAGSQTLPAGRYTVSKASSVDASSLLVSNRGHGVFLRPVAFDNTPVSGVSLSFDQIGGQHVLSSIKTPAGIYTIESRREVEKLVQAANGQTRTNGMTSSGSQ